MTEAVFNFPSNTESLNFYRGLNDTLIKEAANIFFNTLLYLLFLHLCYLLIS